MQVVIYIVKMKILIILLILFLVSAIYIYSSAKLSKKNELSSITYNNVINESKNFNDDVEVDNYKIVVTNITGYEISEIPNFDGKNTSDDIIEKFNCDILINGGLYDADNNPLGIYYLQGNTFGKIKKNSILNGILSVNESDVIEISGIDSFNFENKYKFYMQTGPIYYYFGRLEIFDTKSDYARRVIIGQDKNNNIYVIVMFDKNNYNSGPTFYEVGKILYALKEKLNIEIFNAINLDGGNASLFITAFKKTSESNSEDVADSVSLLTRRELKSDLPDGGQGMSSSFKGNHALLGGEDVINQNYSIKESSLAGSFLCFRKIP